ncbi:AMP-binding protein [Algoriphagus hitonicola]|uniref:O-succinylbenzoic acid--CoA ligase n=1 Tax=Algoriphagus hitonicola TaxID=435880 RepID=A0A1I2VPK8_9BACT|nr:AMP-binding protein [Algoriphagus hitonicola]SFG91208.1 O-succinylbenzoic acid--CoA ligase [Algoriphagus hitonicola]
MFQLQYQDKRFSSVQDFEKVEPFDIEVLDQAIQFCREWLSGKENFEQYTSGSTGKPKKINLTRIQMQASAQATGAFFQINSKSLLLCCLNPAYIAGKMMLVRAMEWNCPMVLVNPSSDPLSEIEDSQIPDFLAMVPLQIQQSLQNPSSFAKLKKVQQLIIGGAPLSPQLKMEMVLNKIQAYQTYGMTETVSHIAIAKIKSEELIYQTLPKVEIGVDDRGALWVKGPMSKNEKIQTNDAVRLRSDNEFQWLGRIDFVVNSGGVKLHPELIEPKIEKTVNTYFFGSRFFLTGTPDPKFGEKLVLFIESSQADSNKATHLLNELKKNLSAFECPKAIYLIAQFKETESGKIDRKLNIPT